MERIFAPIGQGCFAIERFRDGVVIFDCGTLTKIRNKPCVESISLRIEQEIDSNETIQYVFISHLDKDHVNGLAFLLKKYKVKEVVLPLLYDEYKELYLAVIFVIIIVYVKPHKKAAQYLITWRSINNHYYQLLVDCGILKSALTSEIDFLNNAEHSLIDDVDD